MTIKTRARAALAAARVSACLLARKAAALFSDAVGLVGLALVARGLWLQFGEAWALMIVGGFLLAVSLLAALLPWLRGASHV